MNAPWRIIEGDCREALRAMPEGSARCCVTSPPYWGLRDYGHDGQLGLEPTPEQYVANMVEVFREVRRVLADDGTLWLNLGDCYAQSEIRHRNKESASSGLRTSRGRWSARVAQTGRKPDHGLKPKDLVGIPWRVAFALQADGWYLRADIIWSKPNPMPESVRDRPTKAHEYVFLLAKSDRYFYDCEAVKEAATHAGRIVRATGAGAKNAAGSTEAADRRTAVGFTTHDTLVADTRNRRSVWNIATRPFTGAHFATMPTDLVEPCVMAGSATGDTVLDPFAGAGTVGLVANRLGRAFVGVELNPQYAAIARERITGDAPLFNTRTA